VSEKEIRSVMVPVTGTQLLIPNASVAEVISYSEPDPVTDAPDWLLGTFVWRGWQVPAISFTTLSGDSPNENTSGARLCILKALSDHGKMPYLAILAQGFPRLTTVTETNLVEEETEAGTIAVVGRVIIGDRQALVPDLERLGHLVAHATFGALPLTGSKG